MGILNLLGVIPRALSDALELLRQKALINQDLLNVEAEGAAIVKS